MGYGERLHIKPHIYLLKGKWRVAFSVKTPISLVMAATSFRDNRNYPNEIQQDRRCYICKDSTMQCTFCALGEPVLITEEIFEKSTGYKPEYDDLERSNCDKAGQIGHSMCGWDKQRNMPNFIPGDSNGTSSN